MPATWMIVKVCWLQASDITAMQEIARYSVPMSRFLSQSQFRPCGQQLFLRGGYYREEMNPSMSLRVGLGLIGAAVVVVALLVLDRRDDGGGSKDDEDPVIL